MHGSLKWALVGGFCSAALAVAASRIGFWAPLIPIGLIILWLLPRRPKRSALLLLVTSMLGRSLEKISGVAMLGFLDEASLVALIYLATLAAIKRRKIILAVPGLVFFMGFLALALISAGVHGVPPNVILEGTLRSSKGWLLALAVAQLEWTRADLGKIARHGAWAIVFISGTMIINLAIPRYWAQWLASDGRTDYRSAIPSLIGPFTHPGDFGLVMALLFLAALSFEATMGKSWRTRTVLVLSGVGAALSFRRKTWIGILLAFPTVQFMTRRAARLLFLAPIAAIGAILFWGTISSNLGTGFSTYVSQDEGVTARTAITEGSLDVAAGYFPLGAGIGRYGSETAAENYSPEYVHRGFQNIWGLHERTGNSSFLTDTMWPQILGEAGWIGLVAYALALARVAWMAWLHQKASRSGLNAWLGVMVAAWVVQLIFESTGSPVFVASPSYQAFFFSVGVLAAMHPPTSRNRDRRQQANGLDRHSVNIVGS